MQTPTSTLPPGAEIPALPTLSGSVVLSQFGVIRVVGEDAAQFLQGQLTQDVLSASLSEARLAAFCNAKGRMQASFVLFKLSPEDILMICSRDILPATLKRLSMFVMRAKAKLSDASADFVLCGVTGDLVAALGGDGTQVWSKTQRAAASLVVLPPGAGVVRALWCAPTGTPTPAAAAVEPAYWDWLSVRSGVAMLTQAVFEAFVPQMLNYESVGGVSFKKGCYPGQEVVARSQFRGTLKRRAYLAHAMAPVIVGQEVFHSSDAEQACGLVVAAAPAPQGGFDAIISMQTAAAADGGLSLASASGPALGLLPLPYPLLEDI
jgi:folate-binding protein YgfZ